MEQKLIIYVNVLGLYASDLVNGGKKWHRGVAKLIESRM